MLAPSPLRSPALLSLLGLGALGLAGCRSDYSVKSDRLGVDLELQVLSPSYGEFEGDGPAVVTGVVSPAQAKVLVEGQEIEVNEDGSFSVEVPVDYAYRIIEVEASLDTQREDFRVPVFRGVDPVPGWPGGMTARLLPNGLSKLGESLGAAIDGLGWQATLAASLPAYESDIFAIRPVGIFNEPTEVTIEAADGGLDFVATLIDLKLEYELAVDWLGLSSELSISFGEIAISGLLVPILDDEGLLSLELEDPSLVINEPDIVLGPLDGALAELVIDAVLSYVVEPLTDLLLGVVLDSIGTIELGGPIAFETDLLGTSLALNLTDLVTEEQGIGAELALGINEPAASEPIGLSIPDAGTGGVHPAAQAAIALHEGVLQLAIGNLLIDLLGQVDSLLGGFGDLIGGMVRTLPGGDQAPAAAEGWCLGLDPGTAYVARMVPGIAPLGAVYMPDLVVDIGERKGAVCETWLKASLATEINLNIEGGTALGIDLVVAEGVVLEYGAVDQDPEAVVTALGDWLESTFGLVGGLLNFDLADLLGGLGGSGDPADPATLLLGGLAPVVLDSQPMVNADGTTTEGLFVLSLGVWAD
ncbi:MAG: hypothetical protein JNM72_15100 [Deltaproteobacteria bacterium]|nr:hypothetical protein [Deltaproteobacteria bacterium]